MPKRKRKQKLGLGTFIEADLFKSKAFISLKGAAPQVLIIFLGKRNFKPQGNGKRYCINKDSLKFSYIEAKEIYGITQPRFTRAIDELLAKGFLTIIHRGGGYQQDQTIYGLSENWRLWFPGQVVEERKKDACQKGFRKHNRKAA